MSDGLCVRNYTDRLGIKISGTVSERSLAQHRRAEQCGWKLSKTKQSPARETTAGLVPGRQVFPGSGGPRAPCTSAADSSRQVYPAAVAMFVLPVGDL